MTTSCIEIIEDIEDLITSQDITPKERYRGGESATPTTGGTPFRPSFGKLIWAPLTNIPCETQIYTWAYPCVLPASVADRPKAAPMLDWSVEDRELKSRNEIEAGQKQGKLVVVAGCVPQGAPKTDFLRGLSVVGVQQIDRVVEVVEETLKGKYILTV
ncbi:unnamed protein product, partial [Timema podura]|nr:unnamed protein product [Timema podura]